MIFIVALVAGLCVAFANGANDNFKGVATLFGSGTTSFRRALLWATATTFLGSLAAFILAGNLIKSFSGKGLVDDAMVAQPAFAA
ncbi:MAG: inorganic phosphate transporter, partial [Pirellulaceae bacterium]|nr:inorganic phosphate transporter [Pirellulaceae bacterium]